MVNPGEVDATGTEDQGWAHGYGKQRVRAHEQMLSAELCQQLVAELKHLAGEALGAEVDLEMSVPVPSSLYEAIMSALRVGKASPVVPGALASENKEKGMVVVPAKISSKVVPLHQDRYGGKRGALVEGYSAVLYLSDGGSMSFVDVSSKNRVCDVSVTPGRLVVWDNTSLLHAVDTTEACAPRFMLGPMSLNPMGTLVAVGGGACAAGYPAGGKACIGNELGRSSPTAGYKGVARTDGQDGVLPPPKTIADCSCVVQ